MWSKRFNSLSRYAFCLFMRSRGGVKVESIDKIIANLLLLDGNESTLLDNENDYILFRRLIIELTKVKYDIRWCGNTGCKCHPEYEIKGILKHNDELYKFLSNHINISLIESIVADYEIVTVFDRGYL